MGHLFCLKRGSLSPEAREVFQEGVLGGVMVPFQEEFPRGEEFSGFSGVVGRDRGSDASCVSEARSSPLPEMFHSESKLQRQGKEAWPNKPDAVNPAIALRFAVDDHLAPGN